MTRLVPAGFSLAVIGLVLPACSSDASPSTAKDSSPAASATSISVPDGGTAADGGLLFPTSPMLTFQSASKGLNVTVKTTPVQPPNVGVYCKGQLVVTDASGNPVEGLTITVTPYMPVMKHGTPVGTSVTEQGNGVYIVDNVALSMPGVWEFVLKVKGPMTDSATSPTFNAITAAQ